MAENFITTDALFDSKTKPIFNIEKQSEEFTPAVEKLFDYVNNPEDWKKKYLHPNVLTGEWELITDDYGDEVHHWKMFTPGFCKAVIDEAERQNKWTTDRHQYYPTHDVPLKDLGLYEIYDSVLREYGFPIVSKLWRLEGKSWDKHMTHETFIIKYTTSPGNQTYLNIHHDQADYTIHITLSDNFTGGGTWFPRQNKLVIGGVGSSVLFPNVTHPHGARPTLSGKRYCLISFCNRGAD